MSGHSPAATGASLGRSFLWLNATQFLGALNDNVFKWFVVFFLIARLGRDSASLINGLAGICFAVPFLVGSAAAGVLADRVSKRTIVVWAKVLELGIMLAGLAAFLAGQPVALYACLFLMAAQSTLFGPSKYGIVPELVARDNLSRANGVLVAFTYLAIIAGSALAPLLAQACGGNLRLAQTFCLAFAALGVATCLGIGRTPAAGATRRLSVFFLGELWRTFRDIRRDRYLFMAALASAYFSLLGAYLQLNIIPYGIERLNLNEVQSSYLFFVGAIGVAAGAYASGRLSGRHIEFGIVAPGAFLLAAACFALDLVPPRLFLVCPAVFLAGMGAGLFIIPLDAFIQFRAPRARLGEIVAAANWLGWVGVLAAAILVSLNRVLGITAAQGFLMLAVLTLVLAAAAMVVLPDFLLRFLVLVITRLAYRIRVLGRENVPLDGPALLVCNHVSYVDALLLIATQQRRLRFVMDRGIYRGWRLFAPFFRLMGVIPISGGDSPKQVLASLQAARRALDDGYQVVIFGEGHLTRTGLVHEFRRGFERVVRDSAHPIIPVYIGGAWGSIGSYYHGRLVRHWPAMLRYPVSVIYGEPLAATATAAEVRGAVMELSVRYFLDRQSGSLPLGSRFIRTARRHWSELALADSTGRALTFGETLVGAVALRERLRTEVGAAEHVGLLLPSSAGAALANLAVTLLGRIAVNLNYTASAAALRSALHQASLETVITSRAFLERFPNLPLPGRVLCLEDMARDLTPGAKARAWFCARFLPRRLLAPRGVGPDSVAAVIFSSGSTGAPKGVMLSHFNIACNIESLRMVFRASPRDRLGAVLPFFHSLGYTGALWFPLLSGFPACYHPNPLEAGRVVDVIRERRCTLLFATPTFLMLYLRKAERADFASLQYVIAGAEKLSPRLAQAFEERFGVRPLEGYGATELAPVATLSVPHVRAGGVRQAGWKEGSVGLPLPGVAVRVIDPDTGVPRGPGDPGLLQVKGPNVMLGYLGQPERTAEVLRDGWYSTGDVARIDADGFVVITDRLARFSKIGGEMVPHVAVEEALQELLGRADRVLAVTAVAEAGGRERLVVLCSPAAGDPAALAARLAESPLPNLWKPDPKAFLRVESLPLLGSGKLDLGALRAMARDLVSGTGCEQAARRAEA